MCAFFRSSTRFKPRFKLSKLYGYAHILCTQRRSDANEWCGKSMLQVTGPSRFPYTPILSTRTHMLINTHMKLWARNDSWPASSFKCAKTVLCCCVREFRSTHPLHFNFFCVWGHLLFLSISLVLTPHRWQNSTTTLWQVRCGSSTPVHRGCHSIPRLSTDVSYKVAGPAA